MSGKGLASRLLNILDEVHTPEFQQRIAEREAQRTDPWRWYCRLCGAEGESDSRLVSREAAYAHIADGQPCGRGIHKADDGHGRLLHVWSWGRPPIADDAGPLP